MKPCIAYITTKSNKEAKQIARLLIEKKVAACVNIIDNMNSLYMWEGKLVDETETVIIAKTRESVMDKLIRYVKENHSDSCPCVIALPVTNGNKEYLDWIVKETTLF